MEQMIKWLAGSVLAKGCAVLVAGFMAIPAVLFGGLLILKGWGVATSGLGIGLLVVWTILSLWMVFGQGPTAVGLRNELLPGALHWVLIVGGYIAIIGGGILVGCAVDGEHPTWSIIVALVPLGLAAVMVRNTSRRNLRHWLVFLVLAVLVAAGVYVLYSGWIMAGY